MSTHNALRKTLLCAALFVFPLLFIPIQIAIVNKQPWWNLPIEQIRIWAVFFVILFTPITFLVFKGKRWIYPVLQIVAGSWILMTVGVSILNGNLYLGLFSVFLSLFWVSILLLTQREFSRSFVFSNKRWFHGLPKGIPGLVCEINGKSYRASRIDMDGVFLFSKNTEDYKQFKKNQKIKLILKTTQSKIEYEGLSFFCSPEQKNMSLRFVHENADLKKELGDFISYLRGAGYV